MNHNREAVWDNLKFFLILNVVIGHLILFFLKDSNFCKSLYTFIYSYHMPLFFFIAGYFHSNKKTLSKIYYFVVSALLLRFLLFAENRILYKWGNLTLDTESGVPWFMLAMAAFIILANVVKEIDPKVVLPVSITVGCFVGYDSSVNDFLVLSRIFVFFPFYYAGILVSKNESLKSQLYLRTYKKRIFSILVPVTFFIICMLFIDRLYFLKPYFNGHYPYSFIWEANYLHVKSGLIRLLCYCITFMMGFSLIILTPNYSLPVVSSLGTKTMQIYFWHMFFIQILRKSGIVKFAFRENVALLLVLAVFLTLFLGWSVFSFPVKNIRDGCLKYKTE